MGFTLANGACLFVWGKMRGRVTEHQVETLFLEQQAMASRKQTPFKTKINCEPPLPWLATEIQLQWVVLTSALWEASVITVHLSAGCELNWHLCRHMEDAFGIHLCAGAACSKRRPAGSSEEENGILVKSPIFQATPTSVTFIRAPAASSTRTQATK